MAPRPRRRRPAPALAACLAVAVALAPGCRTSGELAYGFYDWGATAFAPNPVTTWTWFGGLGLGFIAASPLLLLSWPLTALFYPEDEEAYEVSATLSPAALVGSLSGTLLSLPLYPFGLPFTPDEPPPPPGPPPPEPTDQPPALDDDARGGDTGEGEGGDGGDAGGGAPPDDDARGGVTEEDDAAGPDGGEDGAPR